MQIEHQKSTRATSVKNAVSAIAVCILFAPILFFTFSYDAYVWGWFFFALLFIAVEALFLQACVRNYLANDHFQCILTPHQILCHCPLVSEGDSFKLGLLDIECIEERRSVDVGSNFYYIVDRKGNKYWLTHGYGNPVQQFLDGLKTLNPKIETRVVR